MIQLLLAGDLLTPQCTEELTEAAVGLLSKIAVAFPDALTSAW